jgi:hypothetical protein
MKNLLMVCLFGMPFFAKTQSNLTITNSTASNILRGNYNTTTYNPANISRLPNDIIQGIKNNTNPDSIKAYWLKLGTFYNRSSGNQLSSSTRGITATFNWVGSKFRQFSAANGNRLVVSDFTFTQTICSVNNHKETFAVLPGNSLSDKSVLVFLAHADSRTQTSCPGATVSAKGMEDNATGVALVMELARVLSQYSFKQTIVFMITTGEEQGTLGSKAFATYLHNNNIPVKAVFNNDIVGSLYCILPTNPVGCTVNNSVDSTGVRIFSGGGINSTSKAWARYIKMQYHENLEYQLDVPAKINIMTEIDRTNRSGDHVPFYNLGDRAARMCSFNEPGDGGGSGREHLSLDSGGVDVNRDGSLDSFFVSFTFLKRNAQVNANAVGMAAIAPLTPSYSITNIGNNRLRVTINSQTGYPAYRLGIRTTTYDFDSVYRFTRLVDTIQMPVSANLKYYASIASQDSYGVESFFGSEITLTGTDPGARLTTFNANLIDEKEVLVEWKVSKTDVAENYEVERSDDGMHFNTIGNVNATSSYTYRFYDRAPLAGNSYYRLRLVATNKQNNFSSVKSIDGSAINQTRIIPSPVHDYFIIKTKAVGKSGDLMNIQGKKFLSTTITDGMRIDATNLPAGLYLLKISNGEIIRFIKN